MIGSCRLTPKEHPDTTGTDKSVGGIFTGVTGQRLQSAEDVSKVAWVQISMAVAPLISYAPVWL